MSCLIRSLNQNVYIEPLPPKKSPYPENISPKDHPSSFMVANDNVHSSELQDTIIKRLISSSTDTYYIYSTPPNRFYYLAFKSKQRIKFWKYQILLNRTINLYTDDQKIVFQNTEYFIQFLREKFGQRLENVEMSRKETLNKEIYDPKHFQPQIVPILIEDKLQEASVGTYLFFSHFSKDLSSQFESEKLGLMFVDNKKQVKTLYLSIEETGFIQIDNQLFSSVSTILQYFDLKQPLYLKKTPPRKNKILRL